MLSVLPFQGKNHISTTAFPGRCPGLCCLAPSGQMQTTVEYVLLHRSDENTGEHDFAANVQSALIRFFQPVAKIPSPCRVAFLAVERRAHQLLQMGRLRVQEQFINGRKLDMIVKADVDAEANAG